MAEIGSSPEGPQPGIVDYSQNGGIATESLKRFAQHTIEEYETSSDPLKNKAIQTGKSIAEEINTYRKQGMFPDLLDQNLAAMIARSVFEARTAEARANTAEQQTKEAREDAEKDKLTGLPNAERLKRDLPILLNKPNDVSALYVDVDYLSGLNGLHGYKAGDDLLKAFVDITKGQIRDIDKFYRLKGAGDEFLVVLDTASQEEALEVAGRITGTLTKELLPDMQKQGYLPDRKEALSASIGVSHRGPNETIDAETFLEHGSRALFAAKKIGSKAGRKGQVMAFSPDLPENPGYSRDQLK